MSLDRRFCFIAIAFFITTIVLQGSSGLIVPSRPSTNDDSAKKLNQISAFDQIPETGSFLDRKAHGRYRREVSDQASLQIYEADTETETISVRLTSLDIVLDGVDYYFVQIVVDERELYYHKRFAVSQGLHCKLWDDALCLKNLSIASIRAWDLAGSKIKVSGQKTGQKVAGKRWDCRLQLDLPRRDPSSPVGLVITHPSPGIVKFQWKHPWFPYSKIQRFQIRLTVIKTSLIEFRKVVNVTVDHPGVPEQKEYERELQIHPSSRYHVEVLAENLHGFGRPAKYDFTTPSRIAFDSAEVLSVRYNETWIEFEVPSVINATVDTWVTVTLEGPLNCTKNESSVDQTIIRERNVVDEYKVDEETPRHFKISVNGIRDSESACHLQPGRSYVIKAEAKDKVTNASAVPIESIEITLPGGDGQASPNVREETESYHLYEVKHI